MLCCFALFVCLSLLASFFLPSHLSFKNMYMHVHNRCLTFLPSPESAADWPPPAAVCSASGRAAPPPRGSVSAALLSPAQLPRSPADTGGPCVRRTADRSCTPTCCHRCSSSRCDLCALCRGGPLPTSSLPHPLPRPLPWPSYRAG